MLSFIVRAYNEEQWIGRTLTAIRAAGTAINEPFELIVVDDASTDRTALIAGKHGATIVTVRNRQIAATRNVGARAASGDLLIFVDADTIIDAEVLRAAMRAIQNGAVGGGSAFRFDGNIPLYGRVIQAVAMPIYRVAGLASGSFLFCTREAFARTGGFDESLFAGEEAAMSHALRRQGPFVILRESVLTSGRKFRVHSAHEILGLLARLALTGRRSLRRREGLDVWYGERLNDPDARN